MTRNRTPTEIEVLTDVTQVILDRLPRDWTGRVTREPSFAEVRPDLLLEIAAPTGERLTLAVEVKRNLEPREAPGAARQASEVAERVNGLPVVAAPYPHTMFAHYSSCSNF